jgi:pimeloyl-ACP methyl ester carboxylesterase
LLARIETVARAGDRAPVDLLGQSYGGWIAQCFARRQPERVRRLILSHSFTLAPKDGWKFRLATRLLPRLPAFLVRRLLGMRIRMALRPVAAARRELYERQLAALDQLVRSDSFVASLAAQQLCMAQSLEPAFAALPPVSAPVMIVESADDPMLPEMARADLRGLHDGARILRFESAGHVSAMVETDRYVAAIEAFLDAS